MKKAIVFFFIFSYLCATTKLIEVLKLPYLVSHFMEHKAENKAMSLFQFLEIHYNDHLENHADNDDFKNDKKLPFVLHTPILSVVAVSHQFFQILIPSTKFLLELKTKIPVIRNILFFSQSYFSIWQPPKISLLK